MSAEPNTNFACADPDSKSSASSDASNSAAESVFLSATFVSRGAAEFLSPISSISSVAETMSDMSSISPLLKNVTSKLQSSLRLIFTPSPDW